MFPGQILPGQMSPWQLKSVLDVPRNLSLKFNQNRIFKATLLQNQNIKHELAYMETCVLQVLWVRLYNFLPWVGRKIVKKLLPNIHQALAGHIPFSCQSYERFVLKDPLQCTTGTAGGRLAAWLQPESYISAENCGSTSDQRTSKAPGHVSHYHCGDKRPSWRWRWKMFQQMRWNQTWHEVLGRLNSESWPILTAWLFGGHAPPNLDTN